MVMTVKELKDFLDQYEDQETPVYFYQYADKKLIGVEIEEFSTEFVQRSIFDGTIRIVHSNENATKALIIT